MTRPILFALLAVAGTAILTQDAFAGCRRNRCCANNSSYYASATTCNTCTSDATITTPSTAAIPTVGPVAANSPSGTTSTYQSYSYEPSASQPVATMPATQVQVPMVRRSNNSIYDSVLRGDRKVNGHTAQF